MHSVSKNLQRDEESGERDPKQRPLQGAFLIPPVLPVVLIHMDLNQKWPGRRDGNKAKVLGGRRRAKRRCAMADRQANQLGVVATGDWRKNSGQSLMTPCGTRNDENGVDFR